MHTYAIINSSLGEIYAVAKSGKIQNLILGRKNFNDFKAGHKNIKLSLSDRPVTAINQLESYFLRKLNRFKINLSNLDGTDFQKTVWKELLKIPFGRVVTYKYIAENIGRPNASRAVGNAVGANPLPIMIPCHRVVSKTGLGGYSCGINYKKKLLEHEGIDYQKRFFN